MSTGTFVELALGIKTGSRQEYPKIQLSGDTLLLQQQLRLSARGIPPAGASRLLPRRRSPRPPHRGHRRGGVRARLGQVPRLFARFSQRPDRRLSTVRDPSGKGLGGLPRSPRTGHLPREADQPEPRPRRRSKFGRERSCPLEVRIWGRLERCRCNVSFKSDSNPLHLSEAFAGHRRAERWSRKRCEQCWCVNHRAQVRACLL